MCCGFLHMDFFAPIVGNALLNLLPRVAGIQGIVEAYRMVLPRLKFSGPTNFSPIINHVASIASSSAQSNTPSVRTRCISHTHVHTQTE